MKTTGRSWNLLAFAATVFFACGGGQNGFDAPSGAAEAQSVTVSIAPAAAALMAGSALQFAATVSGTGNTGATWSVSEGGAGGTIDASGVYVAPTTAGTYHVVAASVVEPTSSATATVTVTAPAAVQVVVSPAQATVAAGSSIQLSAAVQGTQSGAVTWSIMEGAAGGAVTSTGRYTAPGTPGTYHVVGSVSSAAGQSQGMATITVSAPAPLPVSVSVSPSTASMTTGSTLALTAAVTNATSQAVTWSVQEGSSGGSVSNAGVYTAPSAAGTYHVVARSVADSTASATSTVSVTPPPPPPAAIAVTVNPSAAALTAGGTASFTAAVANTTNQAVTWSVQEGAAGGTVTGAGSYTAPSSAGSYHVRATSVADPTKSATATVTVTAPAPPVSVAVNPTTVSLTTGGTVTFGATVSNSANKSVTWSVQEGAAGGTVTSGGVYTAPSAAGTYHVRATSQADATKSATATVTVTAPPPVSVVVSPATASVGTGATVAFAATVSNSANRSVTWSVQEGAAGGTVTSGGVYTAPSAAGTYHVRATSQADATKSATATVTVTKATGGGGGGLFRAPNAWNTPADASSLSPNSASIISALNGAGGWGLGRMQIDFGMNILQANASTPLVNFTPGSGYYSPDCDTGIKVPLPANGAIEGESGYACTSGGDCHLLVVDTAQNKLYELYQGNYSGGVLRATCAVVWDLAKSYPADLRGDQCTSVDAAGLPVAALLFTADEIAAGSIDHAIRFILPNARMAKGVYVRPATHAGGPSGASNLPPYGSRLRLKASYPLANLPSEGARVVARALQKYGMILADGGNVALTAADDSFTQHKWSEVGVDALALSALKVTDFEVVDTGPTIPLTYDCVRNGQ